MTPDDMNQELVPIALAAALVLAAGSAPASDLAPGLSTVPVAPVSTQALAGYDGVVEAVRQTVLSAQVSGAVLALHVRVGDRVRKGQVLVRIDGRAATQQAVAAAAQVAAARAVQEEAARDLQRQRQLYRENYISLAALDQAESRHKSVWAQVSAQLSAAEAARTESGFYVLTAPYDGVVSEVAVVLGDMAMPGRPLVILHDPSALRVRAAVPQTAVPRPGSVPQAEVPGASPSRIVPVRWQVLPAIDPATHTAQLRLDLPAGVPVVPGMFARVWLQGDAGATRLSVPAKTVLRRAELTAVYVVGTDGKPLLRQVRLGPSSGDAVEVLSGLGAGERVALDPQAAARVR